MRDLMRHDPRQLGLGLSSQNQPGVHPDKTTGHGKCIDRRITDRKKIKTGSRIIANRR